MFQLTPIPVVRFRIHIDPEDGLRCERRDGVEPRFAPSLADTLCPPFVKLDLSALKDLPDEYHDLSRRWIAKLVEQGSEVDGARYYVSGATQSTKLGTLYAYSRKNFWPENGFSQPKDAVRGGTAHAPAYDFCGAITAPVRVNIEPLHKPLHEDGQAPCSIEFAQAVGIRDGRCFQGRAFVNQKLIKGVFVPLTPTADDAPGAAEEAGENGPAPDISPRAQDVKGDGAPGSLGAWNGGTVNRMPFAVLDIAEAGAMDVGHQTANYWPQALLDAYASEHAAIAKDLNDLAAHPRQFARFAERPLRCATTHAIDRMALLGRITAHCIQAGSDSLLHSPGVQAMLNEAIISLNTRALFGNITSTRLLAIGFSDIPLNEIWVHPDDAPQFVRTGSRAKLLRMPDAGRKENADGTHEPVWPTVKVVLKEGFTVRLWGRAWWVNLRGALASHPDTCAAQALDFDGDWLGVIWDDGWPLVRAWLDLPNPTQDGEKRRAKPAPASQLIDAIDRILQVDVSAAFGVKRKAVALLHIAGEAGNAELADYLNTVIIPLLEDEGQKGVDNAKKQSPPDMALIGAVSKWLDGKQPLRYTTACREKLSFRQLREGERLDPRDAAWALIGKGQVRPWQPLDEAALSALGGFGIDTDRKVGEALFPSDITSSRTPLGRTAIALGDLLPAPSFDVEPFGIFADRIPLESGPGAVEARDLWGAFRAGVSRAHSMPAGEERDAAVARLLHAWTRQCFAKQEQHDRAWNRQFVSQLWRLSFQSAGSRQAFLWNGMVETLFDMLDEQATRWKPARNRATWDGDVYGAALGDGEYRVSCRITRGGRNSALRQSWTLVAADGMVYHLLGGTPTRNGAAAASSAQPSITRRACSTMSTSPVSAQMSSA